MVVDNPILQAQFWSSLGDAYNEAKRFSDSDKAYDKALALEPDNAGTLNNFAYYLSVRNEQLEKAERMSKRSLEITPAAATYMDTYAWVLFRAGKFPEARVWIEKALASGEPDGVVVEHYGDILFELGDADGALEQWRKAKTLGGGAARRTAESTKASAWNEPGSKKPRSYWHCCSRWHAGRSVHM